MNSSENSSIRIQENAPAPGGPYPAETQPGPIAPQYAQQRRVAYPVDSRQKSPALATILSLMPGLGQIYVGYYEQGFVNVLIVASLISILEAGIGGLEPFCGFFLAFFWLFNLVDAYRKATFYNQALAGLGPMELPREDGIARGRGSLFGGILLIAAGALFLARTRFAVSLEWLEDWWPAVLVVMGGYLVARAIIEHRREVRKS